MRLKIHGANLEFRVQERRVVVCDVYHNGKLIVSQGAKCAPQDRFDLREGQEIAVSRASHELEMIQRRTEDVAYNKDVYAYVYDIVDEDFIRDVIMAKLDKRREREAQKAARMREIKNRVMCFGNLVTGRLSSSKPNIQGWPHPRTTEVADFLRRFFNRIPYSQ